MASGAPVEIRDYRPGWLIGLCHYATGTHHHWVHDILRRLYYLPIVLAAFQRGLTGALVAATVVSVTYLPHAFLVYGHHDPAPPVEKALELVLYFAVGAVAGWLADQERRRRAELRESLAEQRRLQTQLVRAGRLGALGEVVAGIAHEIKNPLHALAGTAEVVDPLVPVDAEERRLWERHVQEIQRLGEVAERFLSFARPQVLRPGPLDLRQVVERLRDLVAADARQKNVALTVTRPDAPVPVHGDRDLLAQVGLNIVINGLHALRESGGRMEITVGTAPRDGRPQAFLRIENDGPPIPDEEVEHIFDPFHSGHEEGTGLGLAIASRIVEQHEGYLEVENGGLGVRFTVWLPRR